MGRALTAIPGPESVFWNPAGLARLEEGQFSVFRGNHLAGDATAFSLILAWQPVGVVGVSYQLLDLGTQELRDVEGNTISGNFIYDNEYSGIYLLTSGTNEVRATTISANTIGSTPAATTRL